MAIGEKPAEVVVALRNSRFLFETMARTQPPHILIPAPGYFGEPKPRSSLSA